MVSSKSETLWTIRLPKLCVWYSGVKSNKNKKFLWAIYSLLDALGISTNEKNLAFTASAFFLLHRSFVCKERGLVLFKRVGMFQVKHWARRFIYSNSGTLFRLASR